MLGWYYDGEVTSVELFRTNKPIHAGLMDSLFKDFRIKESHMDGFPFFCVIGQDDLEVRIPQKDFANDNPDYLYRLACTGTAEDFKGLEISAKIWLEYKL